MGRIRCRCDLDFVGDAINPQSRKQTEEKKEPSPSSTTTKYETVYDAGHAVWRICYAWLSNLMKDCVRRKQLVVEVETLT